MLPICTYCVYLGMSQSLESGIINIAICIGEVRLHHQPSFRAYHAKVVLAGGISDSTVTNKVWVLQDDNTLYESLPPMPTARYAASATSSNNFLLVTAGMANVICASDIVEIYDGK